jgi:hypothetical protein
MNHEATRLALEASLPFEVVDPRAGNPCDARRIGRILVFGFYRFDDLCHCGLFVEPAEIVLGMREWVVDSLGQKIDGR